MLLLLGQKLLYRKNKMKGYSLVELLVVITIMGILFTAVGFKVPVTKLRLESQLESIASDLRWARKKAILDREVYIFRIYSSSKTESSKIPYYFYIKKNNKLIIKRKGYYPANLILYKTLKLKVVDKEYYEWIRFNYTATARAGTIALAEAGRNPANYSITVNQLGRVRIGK